jgi:hypothetical protein
MSSTVNHIILPRLVSIVVLMTVLPAHAAYTEEWLGARPTRQAAEASVHPAASRKPATGKSAPAAGAADPIGDFITHRNAPAKRVTTAKAASAKTVTAKAATPAKTSSAARH